MKILKQFKEKLSIYSIRRINGKSIIIGTLVIFMLRGFRSFTLQGYSFFT